MPLQRSPGGVATEPARHTTLYRQPESPAPRLEFREGTPEETKYIELVVVSDAARVAQSGGQTEATGLRFVETMNALLAGQRADSAAARHPARPGPVRGGPVCACVHPATRSTMRA